ncbi:hypothetical protein RF11_10881 [Thelohanellus kitauei]|uniref:Uncharacterized protein n=1 Tax=Thelohanellus kitauei TaxID=669202 RepID=A0A0C2I6J3_THEKT|nr:hypothetical protein RF11_10881 [Thelohanellus kitauei]
MDWSNNKKSINVTSKIPTYTYGTINVHPIKILHFLVILFYTSTGKEEMVRIPINVLETDYQNIKKIPSGEHSEQSNPFSESFASELDSPNFTPDLIEHMSEIIGNPVELESNGDFTIMIGEKHFGTIKLSQPSFNVGKNICGQVVFSEQSKVYKVR